MSPATAWPRWTSPRVRACESILFGERDDFAIGMPVQIDLETLRTNSDGDDVVIYRFRPASETALTSGGQS